MSASKAGCADPERSAAKNSSICQSLNFAKGLACGIVLQVPVVHGHLRKIDMFHVTQLRDRMVKTAGHDAQVAHIVSNDYEAIPDDLARSPAHCSQS